MYKVSRNDPCPCASGLKYKKCCLDKDRPAAALSSEEFAATTSAIAWLKTKYEEEVDDAICETYLGSLRAHERPDAPLPGILKDFDLHEARKAQREGGEPFDFGFLWERLGLEKERA